MLDYFAKATAAQTKAVTPITLVAAGDYSAWLKKQAAPTRQWLGTVWAKPPRAGQHALLPDAAGKLTQVVAIINDQADAIDGTWDIAALPFALPEGMYKLDGLDDADHLFRLCMGWGLGAYQFTRYKSDAKTRRKPAVLLLPIVIDETLLTAMVTSTAMGRDLINVPAEDMGPPELADAAIALAKEHGAKINLVKGKLLENSFPLVHAVGRAGPKPPIVIDMTWGNPKHPKVTLVGKGITFDTGGLDIKMRDGMRYMKKDMSGAATVMAVASMIMQTKLPVCLRLITLAAENSVSSNAFRPGDVYKSRAGMTVEITNTDAEGRLVLADGLALAAEGKPDLLIDVGSLTGAKRAVFGADIGIFFGTDDALCADVAAAALTTDDMLWRVPLWEPYASRLNSSVADVTHFSPAQGDPINLALFLQKFALPAGAKSDWLHFDVYCWNDANRPGRPEGGEIHSGRALFWALKERFEPAKRAVKRGYGTAGT